jgi:hypothetical protein
MSFVDGGSIIEGTAITAKRLYAGPQQSSFRRQASDFKPAGCSVGLLMSSWGKPMAADEK